MADRQIRRNKKLLPFNLRERASRIFVDDHWDMPCVLVQDASGLRLPFLKRLFLFVPGLTTHEFD